jgi:heptosyltransferase II
MKLVVLAPNWLGDAVMALPALSDVRRHFGAAQLTVAARGSVSALFTMVPGVDAVLTLPGRGGLAGLRTWRHDATALAGGAFDTALLFPNSWISAFVAQRAGIGERWGLATDLRSRLLTRSAPKPRAAVHQAAYYQALVAALGIETGPPYARVEAPAGVVDPVTLRPYVVFAPGAAYGSAKQWPPGRFAELAALLSRAGQTIVLVGSRADAGTCAAIVRATDAANRSAIVDLSGRTTLAELTAVLAGAAAVVSNDSGAMHLAGAVGAPVVAVFGATDERRTAPLVNGPGATPPRVLATQVWCRPCMLRECPIDHRCMTGVGAAAVASAVAAVQRS